MNRINYKGKVYENSSGLSLNTIASMEIYTFRYFPKDKIIVNDELTMQAYDCRAVYEDMPGSFIDDFVSEEYREQYAQMYADIDAGVKKVSLAFSNKKDDRVCKVTMVPEKYDEDGNLEAAVGVIEDITYVFYKELENQKRFESLNRELQRSLEEQQVISHALRDAYDAAQAANNAKTEFLSNMSHDIRTPLNAIIGMTAIAGTHVDDSERVQDCLKKITVSSKHLLALINEVLDMSKIESGKVDMTEENFNFSDLIDNLLTMAKEQIKQHNHNLEIIIKGVEHEQVIGDSLRIQQVFVNLLSNALKYTPDGGNIKIAIAERPAKQPKLACYEVVFEDNGIGMSKEFQEKIFEPFARAKDERVEEIQGTGLGMAISRNIVNMMGGNIEVESEVNKGTKFTVTFFLKLQDVDEINYDEFIDLPVLVVDDDEISMESACDMLNELGMDSEGVLSGREAVGRIVERHKKKEDYFAAILDWKMPDMDGLATTRAIRNAIGEDVLIIIISAYDWSDIEQEARLAGANAFISKPLFKSRLEHLFRKLVGKENEPSEDTPLKQLESIDLSGKRALLAEDNDLNAEIATNILEVTGIDIDVAKDGVKAIDMVRENVDNMYDIILMDIQMPKMNGYDAANAIRSMDAEVCRKVPIIAMTANAFAQDVQAAISSGMNEHIAKPLDIKALADVLKRWVV
jgi:signal transduction histidine kinase/DNA-binding response OmpR family regulator